MTTMDLNRNKHFLFLIIFVLAGGEFYLDLITPLNVSDWIWYFIPLFLSVYVGQRYFPYLLVSLFSFLILIGFYMAPPGINRDIALVGRIAGICALWLMAVLITRRKELAANLHRTERALKTIIACNEALVRASSESALLHEVCQLIVERGGYRLAWVGFREEDANKSVSIGAYAGCNEGYLDSLKITWADSERGRGPVGTALRTGQTVVIQNFLADPNTAPWHRNARERGFASAISLPLFIEKKVFGVLSIYGDQVNAFTDEEVKLLSELAEDLSYGIHSQRTRLEQQQAEAAVRTSEARLNFALQTVQTGAWELNLLDHTAHRTLIHDQIFGYKTLVPEWTYEKFLEHVLPEDRAAVDWCFKEAVAAQSEWNFECRIRRADGEVRWIWAAGSHERNPAGNPIRMAGVVQDITERKTADEKIREQAEMLDLAHDAITIRDLNNRILYWNRGAERVYGWTSGEMIGKNIQEALKLEPFKVSEARQQLLAKGFWTGELTARKKDGREILIESSWTLVRDAHGQPKSILALSVDITEQRKLEQQATRNQRIESLGTLSSGVAHDLNNILTPIMVSIGMLKEQSHDPTLSRLIASLESSTQRGAQLVKQILTFGRGVKGERIPIRLHDIVREVQQLTQETFPKSIQVEVSVPESLWPVTGDPTQIHQVLLNLAINARDAMPNGGKLTFTFQNTIIDAANAALNTEVRPGAYVLIQVIDTGTGMSKKIIERIFEPFFSTKPHGQGTGLGLATSLGIVKSHGGIINVYSEPDKGSTFKIYLPAKAVGELTEPEPVSENILPRGNNELVLLVDDEEAICTTVKKILERYGYRVITAANGAEAVSIYAGQRSEIAVVITDMHMPIMDGPAAIIALQSMNPAVKIIGSSGLAANGGVAKAASSGVRHFVPKPYSAEKILRTLREILNSGNDTDPAL